MTPLMGLYEDYDDIFKIKKHKFLNSAIIFCKKLTKNQKTVLIFIFPEKYLFLGFLAFRHLLITVEVSWFSLSLVRSARNTVHP
jgi:hypothetical protein